ncbi:MAG: hypothetical protein AAF806_06750 [Bacteroidota bacterium]
MTQLTVEIPNIHDVRLFRIIVERLGFKVTQEQSVQPIEDLEYHLAVIARGVDKPSVPLEERIQDLENDREDCILPYR